MAISKASFTSFATIKPISCAILILAVFMLFFPILSNMVAEKRMKSKK